LVGGRRERAMASGKSKEETENKKRKRTEENCSSATEGEKKATIFWNFVGPGGGRGERASVPGKKRKRSSEGDPTEGGK